jgi:hypothetical protein
LRLQARAYMLAHGANPDVMSEDDYELVMVALNDGLIGNKAVLTVNGGLTTGVFNYIRSQNAKAYTLKDVLGVMHDYIYRPLSDEEKRNLANEQLLTFMTMKPDVPDLLKPKI